jgi:DegV family protein with EDD domain
MNPDGLRISGNIFAAGYGALSAWADLIDQINVFPVADNDTGTNLRVSLAPLRKVTKDREQVARLLLRCGIGNSGNIGAAFFGQFVRAETGRDLARRARLGLEASRQAVARPRDGTMLDVMAALVQYLDRHPPDNIPALEHHLARSVLATTDRLDDLRRARVIDSGALAMFVFFSGMFRMLARQRLTTPPVHELFAGRLQVAGAPLSASLEQTSCVSAVLEQTEQTDELRDRIEQLGESVVMVRDRAAVKIHVHTPDAPSLRGELETMGRLTQWREEPVTLQDAETSRPSHRKRCLHLMTDGAGSLPRSLAARHDITLLDSYIIDQDRALPESLCDPAALYARMRNGARIRTAQAANLERHHGFAAAIRRFGPTLYLCTGSVYTGNYTAALAWKNEHDPDNLFSIIDTGAASGRLALITLLTARFADTGADAAQIIKYAHQCCEQVQELVFIDELKYLVRGGRISKTGGFFGDLLHVRPIITPRAEGVRRLGTVRSRTGQLEFLRRSLADRDGKTTVLLQYTDNRDRVRNTVEPAVRECLPGAKITTVPLSLTSGVHMGPGTWAVAWGSESV